MTQEIPDKLGEFISQLEALPSREEGRLALELKVLIDRIKSKPNTDKILDTWSTSVEIDKNEVSYELSVQGVVLGEKEEIVFKIRPVEQVNEDEELTMLTIRSNGTGVDVHDCDGDLVMELDELRQLFEIVKYAEQRIT